MNVGRCGGEGRACVGEGKKEQEGNAKNYCYMGKAKSFSQGIFRGEGGNIKSADAELWQEKKRFLKVFTSKPPFRKGG